MVLWTTFFSLQFQANFLVGEKNLPGSGLRFLAGSGFNEYGSETLFFFHAFSFYTIVWLFPIKRQATRMTQARKGRSLYLCNCISPKPLGSKSPSRIEIFLHKFISTYNCLCSKICFQWLTTWWSTHLKQSHCNVSLFLMKLFCQRGGHDPGQWEADPAGGGRSAQGWRRRGGPGTYTPPGGDHGHHQYMILKTSPQSCLQECIISQQEQL